MKTHSHTMKQCLLLVTFSCLAILPQAVSQAQELIITEFTAANHVGIQDEEGDFSDWIELYNPGHDPVPIGGWENSGDIILNSTPR